MALTGTATSTTYTGNGTTTAFATGFNFFAAADLVVTEKQSGSTVVTTLVNGVDYTVSGGAGAVGTVTRTVAPASGATLVISRTTAETQPTSFRTQGNYSPSVHENAFDRATMLSQELNTRVVSLESSRTTDEANIAGNTASISTLQTYNWLSAVTHTGGTGPALAVTGKPPLSGAHLFEVQATSAAAVGTATFQWREDGGSWATGLVTATTPVQLGTTGVYVAWPAGGSLALNEDYTFTTTGVPADVALTDAANVFTPAQTFNGAAAFAGGATFAGGISGTVAHAGAETFNGTVTANATVTLTQNLAVATGVSVSSGGVTSTAAAGNNQAITGTGTGTGSAVYGAGDLNSTGAGVEGFGGGHAGVGGGPGGKFTGNNGAPDILLVANGAKFPDGSIQTTSASAVTSWDTTGVSLNASLTGTGHVTRLATGQVDVNLALTASGAITHGTGNLIALATTARPADLFRAWVAGHIGGGDTQVQVGFDSSGHVFCVSQDLASGDSLWLKLSFKGA